MTGDVVKVFNRTMRVLTVTKDGRTFSLQPGENMITRDLVLYAKQQNPMPGTEDPHQLTYESLISYIADPSRDEVQRDSLDVIPEEVMELLPKERINRSLLPPERQGGETEKASFFPRGRVGMESPTEGVMDPGKFDG